MGFPKTTLSSLLEDIWGNPMEENRRLAKDFRAIEEDAAGDDCRGLLVGFPIPRGFLGFSRDF